jgi:LacI family transcriptional regulator
MKPSQSNRPISSLELARICKVSQGTVDRALHCRGRISESTQKRILATAKRLGYIPHPGARELMTGTSNLVGAIVPEFNSIFFMDVMQALHDCLQKSSLRLLMASAVDGSETNALIREFAARRVRGIVLVPPDPGFIVDETCRKRLPIISIINPCKPNAIPLVAPNEEQTGYTAAKFLLSMGHRKIVHFSYARRSWAIIEREKGYVKAMAKVGEKPEIYVGSEEKEIISFINEKQPTAIFCHNDWLALSTIRLLSSHGFKIPGDVSVMGVDDNPTFNRLYSGLTTMQYPYHDIAKAVAAHILNSKKIPAVGDCEVVKRDTVADIG